MGRLTAILFLALASCTVVKPVERTEVKTTTTVTVRDTVLKYEGAEVSNSESLDSIYKLLTNETAIKQRLNGVNPVVNFKDKENKVELNFWLDQYGKLQASCESKDATFSAQLKDIKTQIEQISTETVIVNKMPQWAKLHIAASALALVLLVLIIILKRR